MFRLQAHSVANFPPWLVPMSPLPFPEELPSSTYSLHWCWTVMKNRVGKRQPADFSTQRYVARSVANADEPTMNAKQILDLFTRVRGETV